MEQSSSGAEDLEKGTWVVWKTELPLLNTPRTSSYFSVQGVEWNLSFSLSNSDEYRVAVVRRGSVSKHLCEKVVKIATFIRHPRDDDWTPRGRVKSYNLTLKSPWATIWPSSSRKHLLYTFPWLNDYDELKIACLFDYATPSVSNSKNETSKGVQACLVVPPNLESLSLDLGNLLEREALPDVKLRCGDRTTCAHRCILSTRSEVFAAMFRNKMAESEIGIVDVTDMDVEIFDLFLKYVYSGKIPDLSEDTARSLYAVGDKYAVCTLKRSCSKWMVGGLTKENCLGLLMLADAHSDDDFKNAVIDFVAEHLRVLTSESWFRFKKEQPSLSLEVYDRHFAETVSTQS